MEVGLGKGTIKIVFIVILEIIFGGDSEVYPYLYWMKLVCVCWNKEGTVNTFIVSKCLFCLSVYLNSNLGLDQFEPV